VIVCVHGLWHLGSVTAACLAAGGHQVIALDPDEVVVERFAAGVAPVAEPGLTELLRTHAARIEATTDIAAAARVDVHWVTFDTPVDADDRADTQSVIDQIMRVVPHLREHALVIVSSQLPVGTCARLEADLARLRPGAGIAVASLPENLRLGKAIEVFTKPDRVVAGVRDAASRARVEEVLAAYAPRFEWMSVESAEMTKHAINAFLALSVTYANELASVCERTGADAKEVERGLKSESRIGPRAYLAPGAAFAGGTLARDVEFLTELGGTHDLSLPLLHGVRPSNEWHKRWAQRRLSRSLGELTGCRIAVWGLTYKPGTDTLRRSAAVELCRDLAARGAIVRAFDPALTELPAELTGEVGLDDSPARAAAGASALVVATEWPIFRDVDMAAVLGGMTRRLVLDPNRFLAGRVAGIDLEYVAVGVPEQGHS